MGTRIASTPSPAEIKRIILKDVPRPLLERTVRCVYGSCRAAELLTKPFPRQIRHDLFPYVRRAFIERDWRALAADFPNVKATFRPPEKTFLHDESGVGIDEFDSEGSGAPA